MNAAVDGLHSKRDPAHPRIVPRSTNRLRLRILHVLNRLATGGTEHIVLELTGRTDPQIFEHRLVALRGMDPLWDPNELPGGGLLLEGKENSGFEFQVLRLARLMRSYRPHIVHSRNWGAIEAVLAARFAQVPVVIHSEHGYELDMLDGLPARRRVARKVAYSLADAVFAVTQELGQFHAAQAWVTPDRFRVIHNGVDTQRFSPCPAARVMLRRKYGVPEDRFIIGTVGRVVLIKDHQTLLRAMESLRRRGVDAHALIVGSGPALANIQESTNASELLRDRVTFIGSSDDIPDLLNAMDFFALPSISEGMSNTLLEAMASGLPVVATKVGGNPEIIEHERSGLLFHPGDAEALAEWLALLASRDALRHSLGGGARARILEHFSLERMLQAYTQLYLDLARRKGIQPLNS